MAPKVRQQLGLQESYLFPHMHATPRPTKTHHITPDQTRVFAQLPAVVGKNEAWSCAHAVHLTADRVIDNIDAAVNARFLQLGFEVTLGVVDENVGALTTEHAHGVERVTRASRKAHANPHIAQTPPHVPPQMWRFPRRIQDSPRLFTIFLGLDLGAQYVESMPAWREGVVV